MSGSIAAFYVIGIVLYLIATLFFGNTIRDKKSKEKQNKSGKIGFIITVLGFISHIVYFILRWIAGGHAPVSNMFEFVTFLGISVVLAFIILYLIYRIDILGLFAVPTALVLLAYASMFPTEITPLVPSLQSHWLYLHVITVSIAQGILAISFVTGIIYLLKAVDQSRRSKRTFWLELVMYAIFLVIGFVFSTVLFKALDYSASFAYIENNQSVEVEYHMPPIAGPKEGVALQENQMEPLIETPGWMQGKDAPRKFNTVIWSVIFGTIFYLIARLIMRKRVSAWIQPFLKHIKLDMLDEITYRSVAIGFPLFTLGGLIFAAIWAQIAWDRFWGWDPKEVWALITWFFYAAFLHLRLSRGWHGEKSAWLAVIGFGIIMFNIIVVNLVLAGLHSYA
ncbi:MAG: c-type cytochrome biogenesis protein CcsB [Bacilli bacterium]|nr:c-type cytochrome biogenesis protein CcsB [Bacilli bacterium]